MRLALPRLVRPLGRSAVHLGNLMGGYSVGVLGPTAHPGLPLEVLLGVGWCYRL
jgi:hypothetical protein